MLTSAFLNRSANESPGGKRPPQRASWSITIESKYFLKLLFISAFRYDCDVFDVWVGDYGSSLKSLGFAPAYTGVLLY